MEAIGIIENIHQYLLAFTMGLILTYFLTPTASHICIRLGLVDRPGARRLHRKVTPRGGGIVIIISFLVSCGVMYNKADGLLPGIQEPEFLRILLLPVLVLAVVGLMDDRFGLNPWIKLIGQAGAVVLAISLGLKINRILGWGLPLWLDIGLTMIVVLAAINAFNLIDGMDGLATGLALIAAGGLAIGFGLQRESMNVMLMLALAGACLGFLNYNFHPASIFLGDTGSMFLGYTFSAVAIYTSNKATTLATLTLPLVAMGVPFLDTLLAIWRRALRRALQGKGHIGHADMDHLHHRILQLGWSPRRSVTILFLFAAGLMAASLAAMAFKDVSFAIMMVTFGMAAFVIIRHLAFLEIWESEKYIRGHMRLIRSPTIAAFLHPVADGGMLALCVILATAICASRHDMMPESGRVMALQMMPYLVGIPIFGIALTGAYRRLWRRARPIEYLVLAGALVLAVGVGISLWNGIIGSPPGTLDVVGMVFLGLAVPVLVGFRVAPRLILDMSQYLRRIHIPTHACSNCLIYGAGEGMVLLMRSQMLIGYMPAEGESQPPYKVVGILDDDAGIKGLSVWGHPVLGDLESLPKIAEMHHVSVIVISTPLPDGRRARLVELAQNLHISLLDWTIQLRPALPNYSPASLGPESRSPS